MKITVNQTSFINNRNQLQLRNAQSHWRKEEESVTPSQLPPSHSLTLAHFPNVSFRMNQDMKFLLDQSERLRCAYSRMPMISPQKIKSVYQGLEKRPNAQSAINLLQNFEKYMHNIESVIFDTFKDAHHKTKRTFKDILLEYQPDALERLKEKQINILRSADHIIDTMSEPIAEQIRAIRDEHLAKTEQESFSRKAPLEAIKSIKASGADLKKVIEVYRTWYKLPCSAKDADAFIVKYSKHSHNEIAKRLISSAVATVEHVQPSARGGDNDLSNYLLVSAQFNNERDTMRLWEYIMLNDDIDIEKNLQKYLEDVMKEVANKKSKFSDRSWYPQSISTTVERETKGSVKLNTDSLKLTKGQMRENSYPDKLSKKYTVIRK